MKDSEKESKERLSANPAASGRNSGKETPTTQGATSNSVKDSQNKEKVPKVKAKKGTLAPNGA
jgi:hypothetical protein